MTMTTPDQTRDPVDDLLARMRDGAPDPSGDLMARVLADAMAAQVPPRTATPGLSIWSQIGRALGGWPTFGGLSAATAAGLWLGVAPPVLLSDWAAQVLGQTETIDLYATNDLFGLSEG
jgi:hypothetical protein